MKCCTKCKTDKGSDAFSKMKASKDGLRPICRECDARWRKENVQNRMAYQREYRAKNPEYIAALNSAWCVANADHQREMKRSYRKHKPHVQAALNAKYRAAKLQATPAWADHAKIAAIYAEAAALTESTGIVHNVDHFYPLQSKDCCGLHCEHNLRITTALVNQSKGNRLPEQHVQ